MGGRGSGNWWRWQRKTTVEESLVVPMKDLRERLCAGAAGTLTWTCGSSKSGIGYYVTGSGDLLTVHLHYRLNDKEDVNIQVWLTTTPTQFGRPRFWFLCPLIVRGIACKRR